MICCFEHMRTGRRVCARRRLQSRRAGLIIERRKRIGRARHAQTPQDASDVGRPFSARQAASAVLPGLRADHPRLRRLRGRVFCRAEPRAAGGRGLSRHVFPRAAGNGSARRDGDSHGHTDSRNLPHAGRHVHGRRLPHADRLARAGPDATQASTGDSQAYISQFYVAFRGAWNEGAAKSIAPGEPLWEKITAGAVSTAAEDAG